MRTDGTTKQELATAIIKNVSKIHVADAKLAVNIITGHHKHGFVSYGMRVNGYKMNALRFFGVIDVPLIKST